MKVLVVDDEAPARRRLVRELLAIDGIEVVGEAEDGEDALGKLGLLAPDLLMLDVRMPGLDGVALAVRYQQQLPPIIFVTAYDEFAVRAFEVGAVDYLLKPVRRERLVAALARAEQRLSRPPSASLFKELSERGVSPLSHSPRIVTFERGTTRFFDARTIARFWSSEKYTLFRVAGVEHVTPEPLSVLAERLLPHAFRRVHRGELVNLARISSLRTDGSSGVVDLDDGSLARVSRRALAALRNELGRPA